MVPVLQGPPPRVTWILVEGLQQHSSPYELRCASPDPCRITAVVSKRLKETYAQDSSLSLTHLLALLRGQYWVFDVSMAGAAPQDGGGCSDHPRPKALSLVHGKPRTRMQNRKSMQFMGCSPNDMRKTPMGLFLVRGQTKLKKPRACKPSAQVMEEEEILLQALADKEEEVPLAMALPLTKALEILRPPPKALWAVTGGGGRKIGDTPRIGSGKQRQ
ncbi:hypothetical protein DFH08DRAFT_820679 [Mycena albidolilacea]|uniref:Uncharacterized protein n=1 Tax=Mycena albidolilacea TaxID=1033008 RepID=A0AAD6ZBX3_9AGAR|nr:hypothetical protein DFH08DRAFT_820679 [Mycena albidolilacea]